MASSLDPRRIVAVPLSRLTASLKSSVFLVGWATVSHLNHSLSTAIDKQGPMHEG